MTGGGQQEHCTSKGEEGYTESCEQIQGNLSEQYGRRPEQSPGTILLSRRGQNICLPSIGDDTRHTAEPAFGENAKGLQSRRHRTPKKHNGKGPEDSCANATGIFTKRGSRDNASDEQPQCAEGNGQEGNREQSDKVFDDGISGLQAPESTQNTRTTKIQVTNIALQTYSCDTLYVTKNTLVAYTIAVVQNSQTLQYDQMHVVLQTAQNQASLETPL